MARTFVIAEAGVNHNGSLDLARQLVDAAVATGADAVKFQTFRASSLTATHAPKAAYQNRAIGSSTTQLEMLKRLELDEPAHHTLLAHCQARGITFLSTPFDLESTDFLIALDVPRLKISSGDVTNLPLLRRVGAANRPTILSTGMSTLGDVEGALGALASGAIAHEVGEVLRPAEAFVLSAGQAWLARNITVLHCTTEYPAPFEEVNLRAMDTLRDAFGLPVGYSDHTTGIAVPIAAVARGAVVIEKHFTLDQSLPGPDHASSLEPTEFGAMVRAIRDVEMALGSSRKIPSVSEARNVVPARRSLVAARSIAKGEPFTSENLAAKRPGTGISPMLMDERLGRLAQRDYAMDDLIE